MTSDVIKDIINVTCIASHTESGIADSAKSNNVSKSELFWYQNVPHALTNKMPTIPTFNVFVRK